MLPVTANTALGLHAVYLSTFDFLLVQYHPRENVPQLIPTRAQVFKKKLFFARPLGNFWHCGLHVPAPEPFQNGACIEYFQVNHTQKVHTCLPHSQHIHCTLHNVQFTVHPIRNGYLFTKTYYLWSVCSVGFDLSSVSKSGIKMTRDIIHYKIFDVQRILGSNNTKK